MSPLDFFTQYWSIILTAIGGIISVAILKREVTQLQKDLKKEADELQDKLDKHELIDAKSHEETARRVDRIEEANMNNAQSNAVLSTNIENLKEQFIELKTTIKEELRAISNLLEGLFREKK